LFLETEMIALKEEASDHVEYPDDLRKVECKKNCIIWIRWESDKIKVAKMLLQFVKINKECEIYLTCHDAGLVLNGLGVEMSRYGIKDKQYTLSKKNMKQFAKIIVETSEKIYLEAKASFDDIFNCFFLNSPDVLALIIHKVNGILSTLDLDLQTLQDCDFRNDIWDEIKNNYHQRIILDVVKQFIIEGDICLKNFVEQEKQWNKKIDKEFLILAGLIENNDEVKPIIEIERELKLNYPKETQKKIIKYNIKLFRDWYNQVLTAFEKIIETLKV